MNQIYERSERHTLTITTSAGIVEAETFNEAEVWALAHFIERVGWSVFSANSVDNDEAFLIKQAFDKLQDVLIRSGFASQ